MSAAELKQCWSEASAALEPLGPFGTYWEYNQKQGGIQAGNYVLFQINGTWTKLHGKTLKQCRLEQDDDMLIPFLEHRWGLQVSFCTSVARRVPLQELVADMLSVFASTFCSQEEQKLWEELKTDHDILEAFKNNMRGFLRHLPSNLYKHVLRIIRRIFEVLQHTGIDREGKNLLVAWPQEHDFQRCFRIPCEEKSSWAKVLADSEDCATFAYISTKCLETEMIKCRGPSPSWHNTTPLLETIVICHPECPITLQHDKSYYFWKMTSLIRVKVQREGMTGTANLITSSSSMPRAIQLRLFVNEEQKRRARLREAQSFNDDRAEQVLVSASKMH